MIMDKIRMTTSTKKVHVAHIKDKIRDIQFK